MRRDNTIEQDRSHLRTLAIFYYVIGGMRAFGGLLLTAYFGCGLALAGGLFNNAGPGGPPPAFGVIIAVIGAFGMILNFSWATLDVLAGRWLAQQHRYTFCFVMACIECISVPWGTILGIFTIIALTKPSVKALFEGTPLRDPRFDDFDDDDDDFDRRERLPSPPAGPDEGGIREGAPQNPRETS
jgi:hypothetical protein